MVRAVITTAVVVTCAGVASAGGGRKVAVDSEPQGASVYLNEKEAGPACPATPCTIDAPLGEVIVIIELKDHKSEYQTVVVPKRGKVPRVAVKLVPAMGTIVIEGPKGATVTVDDKEAGKAPTEVQASEETHHVVVTLNGKTYYDDFVEVSTGAETTVTPKSVAISSGGGGDVGNGEEGGGGEGDGGGGESDGGEIKKTATPRAKRGRFISASAAVDIGFRSFTYSGVETPQKLRDEKEGGQVLAGPLVELWPGELIGIDPLRGLSILARLQFGVNSQDVTGAGIMEKTNTFWQSMEFSARYRRTFAKMFTGEVGFGYVRDQYQFEATPMDRELVPDVDYQSIRLGVRGSVLLGNIEPYLAIDNRIVTSGGRLQTRFQKADPSGYKLTAGLAANMGAFLGRVEFGLMQYSWDITSDPSSDRRATGASDSIKQIQIAIGYQY